MPISNVFGKFKAFAESGGKLPEYIFNKLRGNVESAKSWSWLGKAVGVGSKGLGRAALGTGTVLAKAPVAWGKALYKYPKIMVPTTLGVAAAGKHLYDSNYAEHIDPRYNTTQYGGLLKGITMRKESGWVENFDTAKKVIGGGMAVLGAGAMAGKYIGKLMLPGEQSRLLERLASTDPIIKSANPEQVMSYYKTICSMAPKVSTDENVVKDLLHNFIKFGRIDMQSLKLLVETEKLYSESRKNSMGGFGKAAAEKLGEALYIHKKNIERAELAKQAVEYLAEKGVLY